MKENSNLIKNNIKEEQIENLKLFEIIEEFLSKKDISINEIKNIMNNYKKLSYNDKFWFINNLNKSPISNKRKEGLTYDNLLEKCNKLLKDGKVVSVKWSIENKNFIIHDFYTVKSIEFESEKILSLF